MLWQVFNQGKRDAPDDVHRGPTGHPQNRGASADSTFTFKNFAGGGLVPSVLIVFLN
jgi:hypothetical protein